MLLLQTHTGTDREVFLCFYQFPFRFFHPPLCFFILLYPARLCRPLFPGSLFPFRGFLPGAFLRRYLAFFIMQPCSLLRFFAVSGEFCRHPLFSVRPDFGNICRLCPVCLKNMPVFRHIGHSCFSPCRCFLWRCRFPVLPFFLCSFLYRAVPRCLVPVPALRRPAGITHRYAVTVHGFLRPAFCAVPCRRIFRLFTSKRYVRKPAADPLLSTCRQVFLCQAVTGHFLDFFIPRPKFLPPHSAAS